jgi:hypothetical protein
MPFLARLQTTTACFLLILFPMGKMIPQLCFITNLVGLLRKAGMPRLSMDYVQNIVFLEEFANITYLISVFMAPV